jgi:pSer/pThr/pTyr-binding forkhead associated (FHA) protein
MKLVFPGGEHAPVELADGVTRVGSRADCAIVLAASGVAPAHAEILLRAGSGIVRPLDASAPTVLNGRQVERESAIKPGDLLLFGRVGCSIVASERKPVASAAPTKAPPAGDDGRTRVRATLPRFMLRGVSGATFGKTYAVTDNAVIGRQHDADIPVPAEEISRHHARLRVTPEGILVEDLGSANGTFINDKRIQGGLLKPGEELRLDTVRFLLVTPGMDARQQSTSAPRAEAQPVAARSAGSPLLWTAIGVIVLLAAGFAAARYFGVI